MFFVLSKVLAIFLDPLLLILLLLAGLLWSRLRQQRGLLAAIALGTYVLSTPCTVMPVVRWLEGPRPDPAAPGPHYEVVIVLSGIVDIAASQPGRLEFSHGVDRILTGITMVKRGLADRLLISGGSGNLYHPQIREARLLETFALELGVQPAQLLIEEHSRNTYENALYTAQLLRSTPYQHMLLITSASHMRRAAAAFAKQGLVPDRYAVDFMTSTGNLTFFDFVPSVYTLAMTTTVIRELVGLVMYRLQGYIG